MNPNTTPGLWRTAELDLQRLAGEEAIRSEVTPVLDELADVFNEVQELAQCADPLIVAKIWALSNIGNEVISVTGFIPGEFVRSDQAVMLRVAPSHDFVDFEGTPVSTRAVKLEVDPNDNYMTARHGIEIYGLNIYIPNADEGMQSFGPVEPKLVVIDALGVSSTSKKPISGVMPILAVRNCNSGVAKVYAVEVLDEEPSDYLAESGRGIVRKNSTVVLPVPDGRFARIRLLTDAHLKEVLGEFSKATEAIRSGDLTSGLTDEEHIAALSHISGKHVV